ncbi:helix-turn-helix transcriptional regulator [Ekhidna sp.]|uniref:helix-turn-helix domain-containing protein n=1 Tax=Ekhidna sp. TaxID=2608089 RepID=UPI003297A8F5
MADEKNQIVLIQFGKRFRQIRRAKDVTLEDLANRSGIAYSSIVKLEKGQINTGIANVIRLAEALGIDKKELMDY